MNIRKQINPHFARAISQWNGYGYDGVIVDRVGDDVLPPESQKHFENLRKQPAPESPQSINDHSRYGFFNNTVINVGLVSTLVLRQPTSKRIFLSIQNTHATQTLFVAFGRDSNAFVGMAVLPGFNVLGFDVVVPQDDVYIIGSGAATTGVMLWSNTDK